MQRTKYDIIKAIEELDILIREVIQQSFNYQTKNTLKSAREKLQEALTLLL